MLSEMASAIIDGERRAREDGLAEFTLCGAPFLRTAPHLFFAFVLCTLTARIFEAALVDRAGMSSAGAASTTRHCSFRSDRGLGAKSLQGCR